MTISGAEGNSNFMKAGQNEVRWQEENGSVTHTKGNKD